MSSIPILTKPFVPVNELMARRQKVIDSMANNSILILFSAEQKVRNADVDFIFRQDSNFWYLTGLNQPQSLLVIKKTDTKNETILFVPENTRQHLIWSEAYLEVDEVKISTAIATIYFWSEVESKIKTLLKGIESVYMEVGNDNYPNLQKHISNSFLSSSRRGTSENITNLFKPSILLNNLRIQKSDWEIDQMRYSADIAVLAHQKIQSQIANYDWEFQIQNQLYFEYGRFNTHWSYPAIVASGNRATTLHYQSNNQLLQNNQMVLVDSGCEYNYYASDITRCYVKSKYTHAQAQICHIVKEAQHKAILALSQQNATTISFHQAAVESITKSLIEMRILSGSLDKNLSEKSYQKYFMHGTGHFIGLDVHDVGKYVGLDGKRAEVIIQPGMCLTVEPGLYFQSDDLQIPAEYRGIGVRIEDTVAIRKGNEVENLTEKLSK